MSRFVPASLTMASLLLAAGPAAAQEDADALGAQETTAPADDAAPTGDPSLENEQALTSDALGRDEVRGGTDPYEDPAEGYYFAGLFYRHTFVPTFILELFTEEASAGINPAFGAEFTYRKDGFDIVGSIWWASWSVTGPFRASGDPLEDTEIIDSGLSTLFLSAAFLWSTEFNEVFAFEYGLGIGLGVVLGDLYRTEAYQTSGGGWAACTDVNVPDPRFCDGPRAADGEDGGHYNAKARKWTDGGSVPNVVPWLAIPHLALRIKPVRQLMMRIEGGFGLGFFLGGSLSYGF